MRRLLLPERPDWPKRLEAIGFDFHTPPDGRYWDESAAYAFSLREIEEDLEAPTAELEQMCLDFAGRAIKDEAVLKRLAIPRIFWPVLEDSWVRGHRNLYGRFDLAYDGSGPAKLLEYNADTPTALLESAVAQWYWLEEQRAAGILPKGADQFNSLHEKLIDGFKQLKRGGPYKLHLTCVNDSAEDLGTVNYLAECARQAGRETTVLFIEDIGLKDGRFVDVDENPINTLFKLYPWEWLFREQFGTAIPKCGTQFIEPAWKALLSSKGLLPFLWQMAPGHPNLLPAYFADDTNVSLSGDIVRKPIYSREGANVSLISGGKEIAHADGPYGAEGYVVQQAARIPNLGGGYCIIGSWVVASQPAGICMREDATPITTNMARFLPHFIQP